MMEQRDLKNRKDGKEQKKDDKGYKARQAQEVDFRNQEVAKREGSDGGGKERREWTSGQASL